MYLRYFYAVYDVAEPPVYVVEAHYFKTRHDTKYDTEMY